MSLAGLRSLKSSAVTPPRISDTCAGHAVCPRGSGFPHEACKAKPVQLPVVRPVVSLGNLGLEPDSSVQ